MMNENNEFEDRDRLVREHEGLLNNDDEPISVIDINIFDENISARSIYRIFNDKIGDINSPETIEKIQKYLPQVFDYEKNHRGINIPEEIIQAAYQINNKKSFFDFLSAGFLSEEKRTDVMRHRLATIWKILFSFIHAGEEKNYFDEIDKSEEEFENNFDNLFKTEKLKNKKIPDKKYFLDENGEKIYVELAKHDIKAKWRVVDKLLIKADLNFKEINDILRGRVILKNKRDKEKFDLFLRNKRKFLNQYNLSPKEEYDNINTGYASSEIKYINNEKTKNKAPVELSVMTKKEFNENESYEKHHLVYEWIQSLIRDDRLDDLNDYSQKLHSDSIARQINQLARKKEIRGTLSKKEITKRIYKRLNKTFFTYNGKYYSYQNVLRCRGMKLRPNQDKIIQEMFNDFNKKSKLNFNYEDWQKVLDMPSDLKDLSIYEDITRFLDKIKGTPKAITQRIKKAVEERLKN